MKTIKERAKELLSLGAGDATIFVAFELLKELVDAPEAMPVAEVDNSAPGIINWLTWKATSLPDGTKLYTAPPAPSVPDKTSCLSTGGMTVWGDSVSIEKCNNFVHLASQAAGFKDELINTRAELADVTRDAERWRNLPQFLEEFQIPYLWLVEKIDVTIKRER